MSTTTVPTLLEQLSEAAMAAKAATTEARQAVKDLHAAAKEAREAEASLRKALRATAGELARETLAAAIDEQAHRLGLAHEQAAQIGAALTTQVQATLDKCVDQYLVEINGALARIAAAGGGQPVLLQRHI